MPKLSTEYPESSWPDGVIMVWLPGRFHDVHKIPVTSQSPFPAHMTLKILWVSGRWNDVL